jgi:hypothetical protein
MQFDTPTQYKAIVTGGADWTGVLVDVVLYSSIGWFLIMLSDPSKKARMMNLGKKVGLVEVESEVTQTR